jgi:hypothetical protein
MEVSGQLPARPLYSQGKCPGTHRIYYSIHYIILLLLMVQGSSVSVVIILRAE